VRQQLGHVGEHHARAEQQLRRRPRHILEVRLHVAQVSLGDDITLRIDARSMHRLIVMDQGTRCSLTGAIWPCP
jgi:hypothetical protein